MFPTTTQFKVPGDERPESAPDASAGYLRLLHWDTVGRRDPRLLEPGSKVAVFDRWA